MAHESGAQNQDAVNAAFAEFLRRRDAEDDVSFEAFCASHPTLADELSELGTLYFQLQEERGASSAGGSEADPEALEALYELHRQERRGGGGGQ